MSLFENSVRTEFVPKKKWRFGMHHFHYNSRLHQISMRSLGHNYGPFSTETLQLQIFINQNPINNFLRNKLVQLKITDFVLNLIQSNII